jgi:hypothetical protein
MRKMFFILVALSVWGEVFGQNDESIRTPKDYLFLADAAYDRQKDRAKGEVILKRPEYLKQLTHDVLPILDKNDNFFKGNSGYAAAVFTDTRDGTIIISHRGTEFKLTDPRDVIADAQIVIHTLPFFPLTKIHDKLVESFKPDVYKQYIDENIQYSDAKILVNEVFRKYSSTNTIEQTGHSLGGSHAQRLAYEYGTKGVTFDPAGVSNSNCFDVSKKDNAENITNYKIHNSLVSSPITTGKNIGKTIEIYPNFSGHITTTIDEHPTMAIYTNALNHKTGKFKTFEEALKEHWEKGYIEKYIIDENKLQRPQKIQVKVQEEFNGDYDRYREYVIKGYDIKIQPEFNNDINAINQNSVQFCPITSNSNEGGHTIKSTANFIMFDNTLEKDSFITIEYRDKWYVIINETDFPRITADFWNNEFKQAAGTYKFANADVEVKNRNSVIQDKPREKRGFVK